MGSITKIVVDKKTLENRLRQVTDHHQDFIDMLEGSIEEFSHRNRGSPDCSPLVVGGSANEPEEQCERLYVTVPMTSVFDTQKVCKPTVDSRVESC